MKLKNIIEYLKQNITIILLATYSISFLNYFIFFKSFNIPIFQYIGLNDLIFYPFENLCKIALLIIFFEILVFIIYGVLFVLYEKSYLIFRNKLINYLRLNKNDKKRISNVIYKGFYNGLTNFKTILIIIMIFVIIFFDEKILMLTTYLIYVIFFLYEKTNEKKEYKPVAYVIMFILVFFLFISTFCECYNKRFEKDNYEISFYENGIEYNTSKKKNELNYLAETSTHIFIYDFKNKKSLIFSKSGIIKITINNNSKIENIIVKIKEGAFFKWIKKIYFIENEHTT